MISCENKLKYKKLKTYQRQIGVEKQYSSTF